MIPFITRRHTRNRCTLVFLEHGGSAFQTELSALSTNLVFVKIDPKVITAEDFVERLSQVWQVGNLSSINKSTQSMLQGA